MSNLAANIQELVASQITEIAPDLGFALSASETGKVTLAMSVRLTLVSGAGKPARCYLKGAASFSTKQRNEAEASFELDDADQLKFPAAEQAGDSPE